MGKRWREAVVLGLTVAAAPGLLRAQEKTTRLETARWAADLNAKAPGGRDWIARNAPAIGKLLIPVLHACVPEEGEELTAFSIYVRLSRAGRVLEVLTDLDPALAACMSSGAGEIRVPVPPRDDYWIQVNLAASL